MSNTLHMVTVELTYAMPDYPHVLQTLVLQNLDTPPHFPWLFNFLNWWDDNIEGKLKVVTLLGVTPSDHNSINYHEETPTVH